MDKTLIFSLVLLTVLFLGVQCDWRRQKSPEGPLQGHLESDPNAGENIIWSNNATGKKEVNKSGKYDFVPGPSESIQPVPSLARIPKPKIPSGRKPGRPRGSKTLNPGRSNNFMALDRSNGGLVTLPKPLTAYGARREEFKRNKVQPIGNAGQPVLQSQPSGSAVLPSQHSFHPQSINMRVSKNLSPGDAETSGINISNNQLKVNAQLQNRKFEHEFDLNESPSDIGSEKDAASSISPAELKFKFTRKPFTPERKRSLSEAMIKSWEKRKNVESSEKDAELSITPAQLKCKFTRKPFTQERIKSISETMFKSWEKRKNKESSSEQDLQLTLGRN